MAVRSSASRARFAAIHGNPIGPISHASRDIRRKFHRTYNLKQIGLYNNFKTSDSPTHSESKARRPIESIHSLSSLICVSIVSVPSEALYSSGLTRARWRPSFSPNERPQQRKSCENQSCDIDQVLLKVRALSNSEIFSSTLGWSGLFLTSVSSTVRLSFRTAANELGI